MVLLDSKTSEAQVNLDILWPTQVDATADDRLDLKSIEPITDSIDSTWRHGDRLGRLGRSTTGSTVLVAGFLVSLA